MTYTPKAKRETPSSTAIPEAPEKRPLVTTAEALVWFNRPLPKKGTGRRRPRSQQTRVEQEELLVDFVTLLNSHIQFRFDVENANHHVAVERAAGRYAPPLPQPGLVIDTACALRQLLDRLHPLGFGFWVALGAPPARMEKLREVLTELGPFLRDRPQKTCGRGREDWHEFAAKYALVISRILRDAGNCDHARGSPNGPVAAIGAEAIARVFGNKPRPATFAAAVRDVLKGLKPDEIANLDLLWWGTALRRLGVAPPDHGRLSQH